MISRRIFLKNGGLALVSLGFAPSFLARTVAAAGRARRKVLIAIFQRGAVDGLNMVVPFGERDYYARAAEHRDRRARAAADAARRSRRLLRPAPAAAPLKPLWDARQLAIVHACGSPDATRSHFDAQDYMETRDARREEHAGRLAEPLPARARARRAATPFRAVALAPQLPRIAAGLDAGARDRPDRPVRHPRRAGDRHGAGVVRGASTPRPPTAC